MGFWESLVEKFQSDVRKAVYPSNSGEILKKGEEISKRMNLDDKRMSSFSCRIPLRIAMCYFSNPESIRQVFADLKQDPVSLYYLEDILLRFPVALKELSPAPVPEGSTVQPLKALFVLHLIQYKAETAQDVMLGFLNLTD